MVTLLLLLQWKNVIMLRWLCIVTMVTLWIIVVMVTDELLLHWLHIIIVTMVTLLL